MRLFLWFSNIMRFCIPPFPFWKIETQKSSSELRLEKFARRLERLSFVKIQISLHTQILTLKMRDLFHHWFLTRGSIPRTNQPWCSTCLVSKGKITIRKPLSFISIYRRKATKITAQAQRFEPRNEPCTEFLGVGWVFFTFALDEFVQSLWNRRFSHVTPKCRRTSCAFATIWHDKSEFPFQPSKLRVSENLLKMSHLFRLFFRFGLICLDYNVTELTYHEQMSTPEYLPTTKVWLRNIKKFWK